MFSWIPPKLAKPHRPNRVQFEEMPERIDLSRAGQKVTRDVTLVR